MSAKLALRPVDIVGYGSTSPFRQFALYSRILWSISGMVKREDHLGGALIPFQAFILLRGTLVSEELVGDLSEA